MPFELREPSALNRLEERGDQPAERSGMVEVWQMCCVFHHHLLRDGEPVHHVIGRRLGEWSVVPADENVDALYEYLIGGES